MFLFGSIEDYFTMNGLLDKKISLAGVGRTPSILQFSASNIHYCMVYRALECISLLSIRGVFFFS